MAVTKKDGRYSWFVACVAFVSLFLATGCSSGSIGIFTVAFGNEFPAATADELAWIGALRVCCSYSFGIIASALSSRIGSRLMTALAGALLSLGFGLGCLATELWHVYLTVGVLCGIGISLAITSASAIVQMHFSKWLHVAYAFASLGDSCGAAAFGFVSQGVLDAVGLRNTLLVFSGLMGVHLFCSFAFFTPNQSTDASDNGESSPPAAGGAAQDEKEPQEKPSYELSYDNKALSKDEPEEINEKKLLEAMMNEREQRYAVNADEISLEECSVRERSAECQEDPVGAVSDEVSENTASWVNAGQLAYERSIAGGISTDTKSEDIATSDIVLQNLASINPDLVSPEKIADCEHETNMTTLKMLKTFGHLLRGYKVWLLLASMFLWAYTDSTDICLLPEYAQRIGLTNREGALGVSILGFGNVLGNAALIPFASRKYNRLLLYAAACLLSGTSGMLYPVSKDVYTYWLLSGSYGIWQGVITALYMSVVHNLTDDSRAIYLLGMCSLAVGFGALIGPIVTGYIIDSYGDALALTTCNSASVIAFFILIPTFIRRRKTPTSCEEEEEEDEFDAITEIAYQLPPHTDPKNAHHRVVRWHI